MSQPGKKIREMSGSTHFKELRMNKTGSQGSEEEGLVVPKESGKHTRAGDQGSWGQIQESGLSFWEALPTQQEGPFSGKCFSQWCCLAWLSNRHGVLYST